MASYKLGYWVRVFVEAPDRESAFKARPTGVSCAGGAPSDIEIEFEHLSEFDEEGREIHRWDRDGEIEPYSSSPGDRNTYT